MKCIGKQLKILGKSNLISHGKTVKKRVNSSIYIVGHRSITKDFFSLLLHQLSYSHSLFGITKSRHEPASTRWAPERLDWLGKGPTLPWGNDQRKTCHHSASPLCLSSSRVSLLGIPERTISMASASRPQCSKFLLHKKWWNPNETKLWVCSMSYEFWYLWVSSIFVSNVFELPQKAVGRCLCLWKFLSAKSSWYHWWTVDALNSLLYMVHGHLISTLTVFSVEFDPYNNILQICVFLGSQPSLNKPKSPEVPKPCFFVLRRSRYSCNWSHQPSSVIPVPKSLSTPEDGWCVTWWLGVVVVKVRGVEVGFCKIKSESSFGGEKEKHDMMM